MTKSSGRTPGKFGRAIKRLFAAAAVLIATALLGLGALFAYYFVVVAPKERVAAAEAQAFARLTGAERRLAIYDDFVRQVEAHHYDLQSEGLDWPDLKRRGREQAAAATSDVRLYWEILVPLTQRFPTSHVGVSPPPSGRPPSPPVSGASKVPASASPRFDLARSIGFRSALVRRGRGRALTVAEVFPGSAAERAGVEPGWVVRNLQVSSDRVAAEFLVVPPPLLADFEAGETIDLGAEPVTRKLAFAFVRQAADAPLAVRRLPGGALYVRFDRFDRETVDSVLAALSQADDRGLVFDLRRNGGGLERELVRLLGRFTPPFAELFRLRFSAHEKVVRSRPVAERYEGAVVVLVGPASASAAETFAGVLKQRRRAVVIGRRTAGAVVASRDFRLLDGGRVQLPVSDVLMPDGRRLEGVGVAPDIHLAPTLDQIRAGRDPELERALTELARRSKG